MENMILRVSAMSHRMLLDSTTRCIQSVTQSIQSICRVYAVFGIRSSERISTDVETGVPLRAADFDEAPHTAA